MNQPHARLRGALPLCLAAFTCLTGLTPAASAQQPLKLILYTPLDLDGNATTASTTLQLYNPNPSALRYNLTIRDAVAKNTGKPADWLVSFYGSDNKPAGPLLSGSAPPKQPFSVRVDLSNLVEAGETTAQLRSDDDRIADLRLVKQRGLPFRVSLDGNPPEKPVIHLVKGTPLDLRLKNDDPMSYPLQWQISLNGRTVTGATMAGPNGITRFTVTPDDHWFSLWGSFFRSQALDGELTLGYQPTGDSAAYPSKIIPITADLDDYNPTARDFWATIAVLFVLALGGFASSYIKVDLVNRFKVISIGKRLGQLSKQIGEIGPQLNSQLRVSLWLERYRIQATIPRKILFTPQTAAVLNQSDTDTGALTVRVDLASQIADATSKRDHLIDAGALAPTIIDEIAGKLSAAQDLLKKSLLSDAEKQKIQAFLGDAANLLDGAGTPDDNLEKIITARLAALAAKFTAAFLQDPTCRQIQPAVPIPFTLLVAGGPQTFSQSERDANTRKLAVIADLVQLHSPHNDILQCLGRLNYASLLLAEQLTAELKDGIPLQQLKAEITADPPGVSIVPDRDAVRPNTSIMMKLVFNKKLLNLAAARRRIECNWDFGDQLTDKGWEVHHYFLNAPQYIVAATFTDTDQVPIPALHPVSKTIAMQLSSSKSRGHLAVELQQWLAGFFVAVIGLFAGAKEKILSLDTASAIFAVFLLGFGIDMAKNLIVSTTSSTSSNTS
ncbi:MAG: hypothetical protein ABSA94_10300 [Acidobacteriaceae bacterium]|jgi:hypothetical protein